MNDADVQSSHSVNDSSTSKVRTENAEHILKSMTSTTPSKYQQKNQQEALVSVSGASITSTEVGRQVGNGKGVLLS